MIIRNTKSFFKHLYKNKLYTGVTVFGFAFSLMFIILLSVYISQESGVDKFHVNKSQIFRMVNEDGSFFSPPVGGWLQDRYPEIDCFTRLDDETGIITAPNNEKFRTKYLAVDSTFFRIFSFNLLEGNRETALQTKHSIVLSESFSKKLFGTESPIGKQLILNKEYNLIVDGVVEDFEGNTHLQTCDFIINFRMLPDLWEWEQALTSDASCSFGLYFLTRPNTNLVSKTDEILQFFNEEFWLYRDGYNKTLAFEPIWESYYGIASNGTKANSRTLLSVLSAIVVLILALAIINYINLSIAHSGLRSSETAIKKLMGSSRSRIFMQFINESVILCLISLALAVFLSLMVEPIFNNLLQTKLFLLEKFNLSNLILLVSFVLITGVVSGVFPAMIIAKFNPIDIVKGSFRQKNKASYSKILIAFQYCVVIVLLIATWMITKQTNYLQNFDLGYKQDNLLWIENTLSESERQAFRTSLENIAGVENVSYVKGSPVDGGDNESFEVDGKPVSFQEFYVDSNYFSMLNLIVTPTSAAYSKKGIWLNKTAIKELKLEPLPTHFKFYEEELPVLGVVDDFVYQNLHQKIGPIIIHQLQGSVWQMWVEINAANRIETVAKIKQIYSSFTGGEPMQFGFVDETINAWYDKEKHTGKTIGYFALLTVIISIMGILAMSVFYIQQRIKEIGIRKVNGAKVSEILSMLNRDFIKWVAIAFVVACPIAYYAMNKWLENFAYKTTLSWWIFALAGVLAMGIALLTVSWQSWRAATRNPVEALRYE